MLRVVRRAVPLVPVLALACGSDARARAPETAAPPAASGSDTARPAARDSVPAPPPAPPTMLVDSIAETLVFAPIGQEWFVAAVRAKRLLVDIGRVDARLRKPGTREIDSTRFSAYQLAVARRSPIRRGEMLRLRGPWGADDALVTGYDWWNGRIVATLQVPPRVDSIVRRRGDLAASAQRVTTSVGAAIDRCARDSVPMTLAARADSVRDSLVAALAGDSLRFPARARPGMRTASARVAGCYGGAHRMLVAASIRSRGNEFVQQRVILVDTLGRVRALRVLDYRFRAHDPILSFDADGDGVDDLAARGLAEAQGATTILRLVDGKRLERLAAGFAWEGS